MTTTKTVKGPSRIERLRALAEHPNTPEHEREVARRALTRMLERAQKENKAHAVAWVPNWQGEKYESTRNIYDMTLITKMIRDEIKLLRKLGKQAAADTREGTLKLAEPIGDAPAEIKIGIRQLHYGSFKIWVKDIPVEWGWKREMRNGYECWVQTDALRTLGNELSALGNAYNYDNSDIMTDYHDKRYYLSVDAAEPGSEWASHGIGGHR